MKLFNKLGQLLTNKAFGLITRNIIPVAIDREIGHIASVHFSTRLCSVSVRFIFIPVWVDWLRVIAPGPALAVAVPEQSYPNRMRFWSFLSHELQDKLVFFSAVDLYQFCVEATAFLLRFLPVFTVISRQVTVFLKRLPATRTGTWKQLKSLL